MQNLNSETIESDEFEEADEDSLLLESGERSGEMEEFEEADDEPEIE